MRGMKEEIANIQDIRTKRDLPLDTLALKGCKGRGCIRIEFRSTDNQLGVRDCVTPYTSERYVLPDTYGFLEINPFTQ